MRPHNDDCQLQDSPAYRYQSGADGVIGYLKRQQLLVSTSFFTIHTDFGLLIWLLYMLSSLP